MTCTARHSRPGLLPNMVRLLAHRAGFRRIFNSTARGVHPLGCDCRCKLIRGIRRSRTQSSPSSFRSLPLSISQDSVGDIVPVTARSNLLAGLIPLQLRKEEERRAVHFYGGEKATYVAHTPAYGTTTATIVPEPEMRSRYMSYSYRDARSNAVALATPVDVHHPESPIRADGSARSLSSLEQEILDRQRRTSAVPLIQRT